MLSGGLSTRTLPVPIADPVTLVLLSRRPRAGQTKTRLIPVLGPEGAAAFHRACLGDLTDSLRSAPVSRRILCWDGAPCRSDGLWGRVPPRGWEGALQVSGGLGARIAGAARLGGAGPTIVIGADAPTVTPELVGEAAAALLQGADGVLAPALDGGYVLAGFSGCADVLTAGVPFGTDAVLQHTLEVAKRAGLRVHLLETHADVDTPDDLAAFWSWADGRGLPLGPRVTQFLKAWDFRGTGGEQAAG